LVFMTQQKKNRAGIAGALAIQLFG
jgi:hypothetical protein